jgi:hypothetical protein
LCKASDGENDGENTNHRRTGETERISDEDNGARRRPDEDASMAKARPRLAKINTLDLSQQTQMGLKQEYDSVVEKHRCDVATVLRDRIQESRKSGQFLNCIWIWSEELFTYANF